MKGLSLTKRNAIYQNNASMGYSYFSISLGRASRQETVQNLEEITSRLKKIHMKYKYLLYGNKYIEQ